MDTSIFPAGTVVTDADLLAPRLKDFRNKYEGAAQALLLPRSTEEVAAIVRAAARTGVPVVPQGGNTSYCGGATPDASGDAILIGFDRMVSIREVDAANRSITVEAGVILQTAQEAAASHGLLLPLSLGAQGSCRIGGNIGTNAGGLNVLRYGMTRQLVLGLEVVLADGQIVDTLSPLRKDNSGLRIEDLFIGTEGTLGVVTAVSLSLSPMPVRGATVMLALRDLADAPDLLGRMRAVTGDGVSAFEYVSRASLDLVAALWGRPSHPLTEAFDHAILMEVATSAPSFEIELAVEELLVELMETGIVTNGVIAASEAQRAELWRARETIPEAEVHCGGSLKHDLAVRVSAVPQLVASVVELIEAANLPILPSIYGHIGDGNVHLNLVGRPNAPADILDRAETEVSPQIYDLTRAMGGTYTAEYGIGQAKLDLNLTYGNPGKRYISRIVKRGLDPNDMLNPGKLIDQE
ncbi:FAD-binding oxidoreductase [Pontivivens ytuae]|uniref:FAD-binding oxidoreductase n=1 Tax=Pontivivens ytuae TaxID=2789856 RepID=A0A7S9LRU2_9RHOB|nr:FAD-binding oxidoreductase [Pontivivens ytuae]QPH53966.1 FAD-binding oxidoreductase [Pontivivens ytuae]